MSQTFVASQLDSQRAEAFAGRLLGALNDAAF